MTEPKSLSTSSCQPQTKEKRILRNSNILKAMLIKNVLEIVRNPELFYVIVVFPIIAFLSIYYGVGGRIKGLTMGVINNEIESNANCANSSFLSVERKGFDCSFDKISCRFVNAIDDVDSRIEKVHYNSFDEAFNAVKSGRDIGFIQIASNFSKLLQLFNDDPDYAYQDDGMIQVFLDKTDLQKTSFVERKLFEAYESFVERLMIDCGKSKNVGKLMIATSAAVGKFDFDFTGSFLPGFILTGCFAIAATITADGIVSEKSNGTWNRLLSVGVKPKHFLIAQLVVGSCLMIIQVIEFVASLFIYQQPAFTWNFLAINGAIFLLTGFVGLLFGLLCSIVSRTVFASYMLSQFSLYPVHFIAGTMWPIEAMPTLLRYVSLFTPFAVPIKTLRRIFVGYLPFSDKRFILTCLILSSWCAFELFLSLWLIRDKKSKKVKI